MPVSAFTKFNILSEDVLKGVHSGLFGTGHVMKAMLSNQAPNVATMAVKGDVTEIAAGNGYSAGGEDVQNVGTRTGAITSVVGTDVTYTPTGGAFPTFRYVYLYNDSVASPVKPLIGYLDYGSGITPDVGEPFTADFGAELFTVGA